jgi:hypothetical protein
MEKVPPGERAPSDDRQQLGLTALGYDADLGCDVLGPSRQGRVLGWIELHAGGDIRHLVERGKEKAVLHRAALLSNASAAMSRA